jgi:alpha-beta hydrolase superfamily lysophospholipase
MEETIITIKSHDEKEIVVINWVRESTPLKAIVLVVHGLAEHAFRYKQFAQQATKSGYLVIAPDLRGHGKTARKASELGVIDSNGWNLIVEDLHVIAKEMKRRIPNLPFFIFGHSLGSEFAQDYIQRWGSELQGVVLCGLQSQQPFQVLLLGEILGKWEIKRLGEKAPSKIFHKLAWKKFNSAFKPITTNFDWLSTDEKEIAKYSNDSLCGWTPTTIFVTEITRGFKRTHKKANRMNIPNSLPIHIIGGTLDSSNRFTKMVKSLIRKYQRMDKDVSYKFYDNKRHELLHETNRENIIQDIIRWMDSQL